MGRGVATDSSFESLGSFISSSETKDKLLLVLSETNDKKRKEEKKRRKGSSDVYMAKGERGSKKKKKDPRGKDPVLQRTVLKVPTATDRPTYGLSDAPRCPEGRGLNVWDNIKKLYCDVLFLFFLFIHTSRGGRKIGPTVTTNQPTTDAERPPRPPSTHPPSSLPPDAPPPCSVVRHPGFRFNT